MNGFSLLKGVGYLVSTASVVLLGLVAWHGTKDDPTMRLILILGMATSVAGMGMRWVSHRREQRQDGKR